MHWHFRRLGGEFLAKCIIIGRCWNVRWCIASFALLSNTAIFFKSKQFRNWAEVLTLWQKELRNQSANWKEGNRPLLSKTRPILSRYTRLWACHQATISFTSKPQHFLFHLSCRILSIYPNPTSYPLSPTPWTLMAHWAFLLLLLFLFTPLTQLRLALALLLRAQILSSSTPTFPPILLLLPTPCHLIFYLLLHHSPPIHPPLVTLRHWTMPQIMQSQCNFSPAMVLQAFNHWLILNRTRGRISHLLRALKFQVILNASPTLMGMPLAQVWKKLGLCPTVRNLPKLRLW